MFTRLFRTSNEPDYEEMRTRALYPDLIGKIVETGAETPFWLHCDCGMLVMTGRDLAGGDVRCEHCKRHAKEPGASSGAPPVRVMSKRGEGRTLLALVVFCMTVGGAVGARFFDAPPRAHAVEGPRLD